MIDNTLNDKNLLIITNGYPCRQWDTFHTFVKAQVDEIKPYFNKIFVISQNPFFPRFLNKLCFFPQLYRNYSKTKDYSYDNVHVYYPRYFSFPEGILTGFRGNSCFKSMLRCIRKNNISFDLIHAHFTWPSGYAAVKLKERYQTKVILHIRENKGWMDKQLKETPKRTQYIWSSADSLIRVNEKDVENIYRSELSKSVKDSSITSPFGVDGVLSSSDIYSLLEFKYKEQFNIPVIDFNIEKDLAECIKQHGIKNTRLFIKPLLLKIKNETFKSI